MDEVLNAVEGMLKTGQAQGFDTTGDGRIDAVDTNGDGVLDAFDTTGDGRLDVFERAGDGNLDTQLRGGELRLEGTAAQPKRPLLGRGSHRNMIMQPPAVLGIDLDGDGKPDMLGMDMDGDGRVDAIDIDGDGLADAFDTTGDGKFDTMVTRQHGARALPPSIQLSARPSPRTVRISTAPTAAEEAARSNSPVDTAVFGAAVMVQKHVRGQSARKLVMETEDRQRMGDAVRLRTTTAAKMLMGGHSKKEAIDLAAKAMVMQLQREHHRGNHRPANVLPMQIKQAAASRAGAGGTSFTKSYTGAASLPRAAEADARLEVLERGVGNLDARFGGLQAELHGARAETAAVMGQLERLTRAVEALTLQSQTSTQLLNM